MKRICSAVLLLVFVGCARGPSQGDRHGPETTEAAVDPPAQQIGNEILNELSSEYQDEYDDQIDTTSDPLKPWNIVWFHVNDKLYFWIMKPIGKVYGVIFFPKPFRRGVRNVIRNLAFPGRFFNTLLQGRFADSGEEVERFLINTTIGVLGVWDPATHWQRLHFHEVDFDQTLGVWGLSSGVFILWPWWGPSSVRGTVGAIGETVLNPIISTLYVTLLDRINNISLDLDLYESFVDIAVDPYSGLRDAYIQNRKKKIEESRTIRKQRNTP